MPRAESYWHGPMLLSSYLDVMARDGAASRLLLEMSRSVPACGSELYSNNLHHVDINSVKK
jgi:hypothetical protein